MTEEEILFSLDNSNDGFSRHFVELGEPYCYLFDTRLNVFRADDNNWAIAIERLGYNPRAGAIILEIHYYGNCLTNLEHYNGRPTSSYRIYPIDHDSFEKTVDGESLKDDGKYWIVRGQKINLINNKQDFSHTRTGFQEEEVSVVEAGRMMVEKYRELFRASQKELYKSIPSDLKKILMLNEWYHKDFSLNPGESMTGELLLKTYNFNKSTGLGNMTFEEFSKMIRQQEIMNKTLDQKMWNDNRPSSYETWQLIAKVIANNDSAYYKPTLPANTHWSNWPDSGSL